MHRDDDCQPMIGTEACALVDAGHSLFTCPCYLQCMVSGGLAIDICVCTFRRPHIAVTLQSLAALVVKPNWTVRAVVADNDDEPTARGLVETTAHDCGLPVLYLHAPACNISVARNACLRAATAPLVAFIDDDEIASPDWLVLLIAALEGSHADVVLGPVQAVYPTDCPGWLRKGDFHSTKPIWVHGEIVTGYTCNVIFRRTAPALTDRRFRLDLGGSGGEDSEFFSAVRGAGGTVAYAEKALITEPVANDRANMSWLLRRRFRCGETHGLLLLENGAGAARRIGLASIASAKAGVCLLAGCLYAARWRYWLLRGTLHAGVVHWLLFARPASGPAGSD